MKPIDLLKAAFYPLFEFAVLIPMVFFTLLLSFAHWGGVLGLFMMFLVLPAVFRYQMIVLEARAKNRVPETPGVEFFDWFGNAWALFPLPLILFLIWAVGAAGTSFGRGGAIAMLSLASIVLPASLVVLAATHSPLQSVNPTALARLFRTCGKTFWIASVYLVLAGWLSIETGWLNPLLANFIQLFLTFSFFSVTGTLVEPYGLVDDVSIPEALELEERQVAANIEKSRGEALTHAYGFASRGNRQGGFKHVFDALEKDPDPVAAWAWFFTHMLEWDDPVHALFFAQHYLHDLLLHGEKIPAVKLMLRCRLIDAQFKPKSEDLAAAIGAAESSGNIELAAVLKGY